MDILVSDATQDIWVDDNQTTKLIKFDASGTRHLEWDEAAHEAVTADAQQLPRQLARHLVGHEVRAVPQ